MNEKKNGKKGALIAVISVVVLIAAAAAAYLFFGPKTIAGDWELVVNPELGNETPDEAQSVEKVFYTFTKPGEYGDGTYKTYFDGGVEEGAYKLSEKDGKRYINMGTEDLEYRIEGVKLFKAAKLTITYPEFADEQTGQTAPSQDYIFEQAESPKYEKCSYKSYETDKALVGEWTTNERTLGYFSEDLSYTQTVKFTDKGIMTIHYQSDDLALDRYMYYAYTAENGELSFSLVTDPDTVYTVSYEVGGDGTLKFTEDNTSDSIFADSFFSDVVYSSAT